MTDQKVRIGVSGVGSIGFRHARLLAARADVELYLCDPVTSHFDPARGFGNLRGTTDSFDKMLEWPLDGVVIATPDRFHVEQGIKALQRGLAVLVEKPVAETVEEGLALLAAAQETGKGVMVGYVLHHTEVMRAAREVLDQRLIGTPVSFQAMLGSYVTLVFARNRFSAADRNRIFLDYSHEWDYINWFLGPVSNVIATRHQSGDMKLTQNPNVVDALLELESGATGTAHLDYVQDPGQRSFSIIGDRGILEVDAGEGTAVVKVADEPFARTYKRLEHRDAAFERQLEHFVKVIRGVEKPLVTVENGLRALAVAEALIASCESRSWQAVRRIASSVSA